MQSLVAGRERHKTEIKKPQSARPLHLSVLLLPHIKLISIQTRAQYLLPIRPQHSHRRHAEVEAARRVVIVAPVNVEVKDGQRSGDGEG